MSKAIITLEDSPDDTELHVRLELPGDGGDAHRIASTLMIVIGDLCSEDENSPIAKAILEVKARMILDRAFAEAFSPDNPPTAQ